MTQDKQKKYPTLEISFLCLTQDKKMPTFEINICVKFDTRRKRKSQKIFPLSRVKFYANVIIKCRQFFLYRVRNFFVRPKSNFMQTLFSNIGNFFLSRVGNFFVRPKSNFMQTLFSNVDNFFILKSEIILESNFT